MNAVSIFVGALILILSFGLSAFANSYATQLGLVRARGRAPLSRGEKRFYVGTDLIMFVAILSLLLFETQV